MLKIKPILILFWLLLVFFFVMLSVVLLRLSPGDTINLVMFYSSLFGASLSAFTLIGFYLRRTLGPREWVNHYFGLSLRQAVWFALLITASFFLSSKQWFSWLNASFLVLALIFIEGYLLTKDKN